MEEKERQDTQVTEPQVPEIPPSEESAEALKSRLVEAEKKLAETEKGLKTARSTITEKDKALKEAQNLRELIEGMKGRIDAHEVILKTFDNNPDEPYEPEEKPKKKSVEEALKGFQQKQYEEKYRYLAKKADDAVKEAGLDMQTSPKLKLALKMFTQYGDPEGGYEEALRVAEVEKAEAESKAKIPEKKEETPMSKEQIEAEAKKLADQMYQERLKKDGLLTPEGGIPAGKLKLTVEDVKKMSPEERFRRSQEIAELPLT